METEQLAAAIQQTNLKYNKKKLLQHLGLLGFF